MVRFWPRLRGALPRARSPRGGAGVGPGQAEMTAELVDPDQAGRLDRRDLLPPGRPGRRLPLAGAQRLFFRVQPKWRVITRLIVAVETCTPWASAQRAQCSANVASG